MHVRVKSETRPEYEFQNYRKGWKLKVMNDYGNYYTGIVKQPTKLRDTNGLEKTNWHYMSCIAVHKDDCFVLTNSKLAPNGNIITVS